MCDTVTSDYQEGREYNAAPWLEAQGILPSDNSDTWNLEPHAAPGLDDEPSPAPIQSHSGYRPPRRYTEARLPTRKAVRRDEGLVEALDLPTISSYNMRSGEVQYGLPQLPVIIAQ